MYFGAGASFVALQWWPTFRRRSAGIGLAILALGLVTSSFADHVWQLILTQGALYAVGGILLYSSVILLMDEWFIRKKGIAFGVMWAGTGFSGVSVPYIFSWGLAHFSFRTMLRAWAVAVVVLSAPLLYFVKPRVPISRASSVGRFNLDFVFSRKFFFLELGNILEGLGYFVPSIYLPTYAHSLGLSNAATTATVAVLNGAAVFGCVSHHHGDIGEYSRGCFRSAGVLGLGYQCSTPSDLLCGLRLLCRQLYVQLDRHDQRGQERPRRSKYGHDLQLPCSG